MKIRIRIKPIWIWQKIKAVWNLPDKVQAHANIIWQQQLKVESHEARIIQQRIDFQALRTEVEKNERKAI